ncbi:UNVERIFIED_CONTAM: hypothetical protein GTU68_039429 [Idotea baltica]|nr:hypothetical protein [Idotea baltica]
MALYNKVNREELKAALANSTEDRITLSFYRYVSINDTADFRDKLFIDWEKLNVFGRIYVAKEGINAQISVPGKNWDEFETYVRNHNYLGNDLRLNIAVEDDGKSFYKLKIKVRPKIVADGLNDENFDVTNRGKHLSAEEFNDLTKQDNTIVVDMRNHYESEVGHFNEAICPDVDTFREALPVVEEILQEHKDKHIVMYCTGGIRCEKASAYYKHKGFEHVYQLDGGIIQYARDVKENGMENKFIGKNFVFDERLGERISDEIIANCHQCGAPCDTHVNCKNVTCNLLFIQCEECANKQEGCCSDDCQEFIHLPEEEQLARRKGLDNGIRIFSKGRLRK